MEDTIIVKTHYAYMLRADIPPLKSSQDVVSLDNLTAWLATSGSSYHLGTIETGEQTGKLHFQMVIWFESKLDNKEKNRLRNWWRGKCGNYANATAFTSARKIVNLSSYSTKEDAELITNLSQEQLKKIPEWKNKRAMKEQNKEKFERLLKEKVETFSNKKVTEIGIDSYTEYGSDPWNPHTKGKPDLYTFYVLLKEAHIDVYGYKCKNSRTYFDLAETHGIISYRQYLQEIGVLKI